MQETQQNYARNPQVNARRKEITQAKNKNYTRNTTKLCKKYASECNMQENYASQK